MKNIKTFYTLIPARGGSKGVPRKNIVKINGKPLISYTIEQSMKSKLIGKTFVSTDDPEIASISKKYGAIVPFKRPKKISGDFATDFDVFFNFAKFLEKNGDLPDYFVHLRATNPMRKLMTIDKAIKIMRQKYSYDTLRSVNIASQSPYKMWLIKNNNLTQLIKYRNSDKSHSMPRQALPIVYWQNGYIDIIKSSVILNKGSMTGRKIYPLIINEKIYEVDYPEDVVKLQKAIKKKTSISFKKKIRYPV